ncbi:MAG TPA: CBS domain-containing protein [Candidatus Binataceae bacterium]|nr:CBS domain-containing protein [Candidatus Binataceae bacterium]
MAIHDDPMQAREDVEAFDQDDENLELTQLGSALLRETLKDALSNAGLILDEQTPLEDALREMREHRQGCVLVTRDGKLSGIFTERDVLMKVVGTNIDLARTPIRPYMTRDPVRLPEDAIVAYALNKMCLEGFRHVPLTDADGRPVGVVSMRDIIEYLSGFFPKDVLNLPPEPTSGFRNREGA